MRKLIFIFTCFSFLSCTKKQTIEQISRDNDLFIHTYGQPFEDRFVTSFTSTGTSKDTLVISKFEYNGEKEKETSKKIKLSPKEVDSLYSYFQDIKTSFKPIGRESKTMDGTSLTIIIENNATSVSYSYRGLDKAENATMEIRKLMKFINSRLPKDFQVY